MEWNPTGAYIGAVGAFTVSYFSIFGPPMAIACYGVVNKQFDRKMVDLALECLKNPELQRLVLTSSVAVMPLGAIGGSLFEEVLFSLCSSIQGMVNEGGFFG